jgi:hypothetical protein
MRTLSNRTRSKPHEGADLAALASRNVEVSETEPASCAIVW